jgi:hypothetical protein
MRSISEILRLLPVLRSELAAQQFKAEVGHFSIEDAMSCLDECEGHLALAESEIDHEAEMMEPAE